MPVGVANFWGNPSRGTTIQKATHSSGTTVKLCCRDSKGKQTIQIGTDGIKVCFVGRFKMTIDEVIKYTTIAVLIREIDRRLVAQADDHLGLMP